MIDGSALTGCCGPLLLIGVVLFFIISLVNHYYPKTKPETPVNTTVVQPLAPQKVAPMKQKGKKKKPAVVDSTAIKPQ
ncbi:MAG: hypothetical protein ABIO24_08535 [Saprospiraceae bacterium]